MISNPLLPHINRPVSIAYAGITALLTIVLAIFLPLQAAPFFSGGDGVRWVAPLILVCGCAGVIYFLLLPQLWRYFNSRFAMIIMAVLFLSATLFVFVAVQRGTSSLRALESYTETAAIRFALHGVLYPDPQTEPMSTIYAPFYFVLSGFLYRLLPPVFYWGKIVSIISTLLCALAVYQTTLRIQNSRTVALGATTAFFSTYAIMSQMYDWTLVDPLLMCFLAWAFMFFIRNTARSDLYTLCVMTAACFVKQSAVFPLITVSLIILFTRRPWWVFAPLISGAVTGLILLWITNGLVYEYLVHLPSHFSFLKIPQSDCTFRLFVLQLPLWIAAFVGWRSWMSVRIIAFVAICLGISLLGISAPGGLINSLFPIEPLLCIVAGAGLWKFKPLLVVQLLIGFYNPFTTLYPYSTLRQEDRQIVAAVKAAPGPVWLPSKGYLELQTGKSGYDHYCALEVWMNGDSLPLRLSRALHNHTFNCIIVSREGMLFFPNLGKQIMDPIEADYIKDKTGPPVIYRLKSIDSL